MDEDITAYARTRAENPLAPIDMTGPYQNWSFRLSGVGPGGSRGIQ
jgi:hypothetical protein